MRLVTYRVGPEQRARLGVADGDFCVDVAALGACDGLDFPDTMLDLIDFGAPALVSLRDTLDRHRAQWPVGAATHLANVDLLAPIPRPRKNIFGIGLNYVEHVAESRAIAGYGD